MNHQDPVMTAHPPGSQPGPVVSGSVILTQLGVLGHLDAALQH
jgi:hypothetical protein